MTRWPTTMIHTLGEMCTHKRTVCVNKIEKEQDYYFKLGMI